MPTTPTQPETNLARAIRNRGIRETARLTGIAPSTIALRAKKPWTTNIREAYIICLALDIPLTIPPHTPQNSLGEIPY